MKMAYILLYIDHTVLGCYSNLWEIIGHESFEKSDLTFDPCFKRSLHLNRPHIFWVFGM